MKSLVRCLLGFQGGWDVRKQGALQGVGLRLGQNTRLITCLSSLLLSSVMSCLVFGKVHSSLKLITYTTLLCKSPILAQSSTIM